MLPIQIREIVSPGAFSDPALAARATESSKGRRTRHYLALAGQTEIGFFALDHLPELNTVALYELFVAPKLRGNGWGRALMERIEALAREHGYRCVTLTPSPLEAGFSPARLTAWYARCGYRPRRDLPSEYEKELA